MLKNVTGKLCQGTIHHYSQNALEARSLGSRDALRAAPIRILLLSEAVVAIHKSQLALVMQSQELQGSFNAKIFLNIIWQLVLSMFLFSLKQLILPNLLARIPIRREAWQAL